MSLVFTRLPAGRGQLPAEQIYFFRVGMRSLKQIEASRLNGAKSRGPVKEKEALAAERNAMRYQLLCETVVLSGESTARFLEMANTFVAQLKPANEVEAVLIDNMATSRWCQLRASGLRKSTIENEMARHEGPAPNRAAEAFKDPGGSLARLRAEEISHQREFGRNLRALLQLKDCRLIPGPGLTIELTPTGGTWDPEPSEE